MALITYQRAASLIPNFDNTDNGVLTDIVNAASSLIETYCNRNFALTTYDQLYSGTGHRNLILDQYPVTKVERIMHTPTQIVSIANTKSTVSRASFRLDRDNLYLTSMANGVETSRTIARSSVATVADLAAAANAFSSDGWTATALGLFSTWSVADLYAPQGGHEVRWGSLGYLTEYVYGVPASLSNPQIGEVVSNFGFVRGYNNYRVIFEAGFERVPSEIQQACAELAASVYQNRSLNPNLQSESLGGYSYTNALQKSFDNLSLASKYAVEAYKVSRIVRYKVM